MSFEGLTAVEGVVRLTKMEWAGWVVSGLLGLFLLSGAVNAFMGSAQVLEGLGHLGFPREALVPVGIAELLCSVLYLVPRTGFVGAILMTAYMGGAVASHARIGERMWVVPVVFGVLVWFGLGLRDGRFRGFLLGRV